MNALNTREEVGIDEYVHQMTVYVRR